jgi:hypothetical protein
VTCECGHASHRPNGGQCQNKAAFRAEIARTPFSYLGDVFVAVCEPCYEGNHLWGRLPIHGPRRKGVDDR